MLFLIIVSFEETSLNLTVIFDLAFIHLELLKTDSINGNICLTLLMFLLLFLDVNKQGLHLVYLKERNSLLIADHYNSHDNLNCVVIVKSNYFILTVVVFTDKLLPGSDNIGIDLSKGIIIET
jgi:hypothetical protein